MCPLFEKCTPFASGKWLIRDFPRVVAISQLINFDINFLWSVEDRLQWWASSFWWWTWCFVLAGVLHCGDVIVHPMSPECDDLTLHMAPWCHEIIPLYIHLCSLVLTFDLNHNFRYLLSLYLNAKYIVLHEPD